ncbi:NAD(P)-binding protein [Actinomyces wuliandei]|uniref:NAD(P)-binding protein n=1 Tax=Actinomyces wuliandei TaxID=2057743 RepID=UPI000FDCD328|nr:NAD(P)-binding protein [Actinomyces wuliandei]
MLTGLAVAFYSKLALMVTSTGVSQGLLGQEWLQSVSLAVALSSVVASVVNKRARGTVHRLSHAMPDHAPDALHPSEVPVEAEEVDTVVFGMGRVGLVTYQQLIEDLPAQPDGAVPPVLGVDNDADKVEHLVSLGLNVIEGDATDTDFWERLGAGHVRTAVLAMPEPGASLTVLDWIDHHEFAGEVLAVARYRDEAREMKERGVDVVINIYEGVGKALAHAAEDRWPSTSSTPEPVVGRVPCR